MGKKVVELDVKHGMSYTGKHKPSGEEWHIIGINLERNLVCAAGWPPTMAKLSDCEDMEVNKVLTKEELEYRHKQFGSNWD